MIKSSNQESVHDYGVLIPKEIIESVSIAKCLLCDEGIDYSNKKCINTDCTFRLRESGHIFIRNIFAVPIREVPKQQSTSQQISKNPGEEEILEEFYIYKNEMYRKIDVIKNYDIFALVTIEFIRIIERMGFAKLDGIGFVSKVEKQEFLKKKTHSRVFTFMEPTEGKEYVIKQLNNCYSGYVLNRMIGEIFFLLHFYNNPRPNIVKIHKLFYSKVSGGYHHLNLMFDRVKFECSTYVKFNGIHISLIHKIIEAVKVLHDEQILHGDIKPENIMVDENENVVLIDLGHSKRIFENEKVSGISYTRGFMPPEVTRKATYGYPADIFALGCTFYNLLTGEYYTDAIDEEAGTSDDHNLHEFLLKRIRDPLLTTVLKHCLYMNEESRVTIDQLFKTVNEHQSNAKQSSKS